MKRLGSYPLFLCMGLAAFGETRPNILWFVVDDMWQTFSTEKKRLKLKCRQTCSRRSTIFQSLCYLTRLFDFPHCLIIDIRTRLELIITVAVEVNTGFNYLMSTSNSKIFQEAGYFTCIGSGLKNFDFEACQPKREERERQTIISTGF